MAADLRAARPEAAAGELVRPACSVKLSRSLAVTSPYLSLYSGVLRRRLADGPPRAGAAQGRPRADDAARIGDCLHSCADRRAGRAVFHRLEPVPAAVRGRGLARSSARRCGWAAGSTRGCCRRRRCACARSWSAAPTISARCAPTSSTSSSRSATSCAANGAPTSSPSTAWRSISASTARAGSTGRPRTAASISPRCRSTGSISPAASRCMMRQAAPRWS